MSQICGGEKSQNTAWPVILRPWSKHEKNLRKLEETSSKWAVDTEKT